MSAVWRARVRVLDQTASKPSDQPRETMCSALRLACDCPLGVSWLKSLLPCIRPAAFQVLWPWRSRVNVLVWVVGEGGVGAIGAAIGAGGRFILIYSDLF